MRSTLVYVYAYWNILSCYDSGGSTLTVAVVSCYDSGGGTLTVVQKPNDEGNSVVSEGIHIDQVHRRRMRGERWEMHGQLGGGTTHRPR